MKIELKNVKFYESLSEETNCFTADIFFEGKKLGYCKNEGNGGNTDYNLYDYNKIDILKKIEKHFLSLPKKVIKYNDTTFEIESNFENHIDELFENWLKVREQKKISKGFSKGICYSKNGNIYIIEYKSNGKNVPIEYVMKSEQGKATIKNKVNELKGLGYSILNTNFNF
jgi:hypothetical protein